MDPTTPGPPPPGPTQPPQYRPGPARLYRSRDERMIAGVCGGIAQHFGIDPVLVRLVVVALTITGGAGLLAYVIAWIVIPEAPPHPFEGRVDEPRESRGWSMPALVLIVLGAIVLLPAITSPWHHGFGWNGGRGSDVLPALLLLGIGAFLLLRPRNDERHGGGWQPPSPPRDWSPPMPPPDRPFSFDMSTAGTATAAPDAPDTTDTADATDAPDTAEPDATTPFEPVQPWWSTFDDGVPPGQPPAPPEMTPPPPRSKLPGIVLALLLIGGGVAWLLHATDAVDLTAGDVAAGALLVIGLGVLAGAWIGRSWGLIVLGVLLAAGLAGAARLDAPLDGGFGDRTWAPATLEQLRAESPYRLTGGEADLDLTDIDPDGRRVVVDASVTFGELRVVVPEDVTVELDARVTGGEIITEIGEGVEGMGLHVTAAERGDEGAGTIVLDLRMGFGELRVVRGV